MLYDYGVDEDGNRTIVDAFSRRRVPLGEEEMILALIEMGKLKEKNKQQGVDPKNEQNLTVQ